MKKLIVLISILSLILTSGILTGCTPGKESLSTEEDGEEVDIYFMKTTDTAFSPEKEARKIKNPMTAEKLARELMQGPKSEELDRIIPAEAEVLGIEINDGIAYVNFSDEIKAGNYGSEVESVLITSIVKTFMELPEVDAVQILVENEKVETIAGHIEVSEPLTR